jgi:phage baseplate assembly protein W
MTIYRGFSTQNKSKNWKLTDFELIKQDLMNHFMTKQGERVMNPNFGTVIWNLIFEPFTESVKTAIYDEINRIKNLDPRIVIEQAIITDYQHGIQLDIALRVLETNQLERMTLTFDQRLLTE